MTLTDNLKDNIAGSAQTGIDNNFTHGAAGTGTSAEDDADNTLDTEVVRKSRANFTQTGVSNGSGDTTVSLFINSTEANGNTLTEFGFFNDPSAGDMQSRDLIEGIDKNNGIEIFFELSIGIEVTESA